MSSLLRPFLIPFLCVFLERLFIQFVWPGTSFLKAFWRHFGHLFETRRRGETVLPCRREHRNQGRRGSLFEHFFSRVSEKIASKISGKNKTSKICIFWGARLCMKCAHTQYRSRSDRSDGVLLLHRNFFTFIFGQFWFESVESLFQPNPS